jgi:hypothetical protein
MIETGRLRDQLYLGAVIALLLLMSLMSGYLAVAAAAVLFVLGLMLYPDMRPRALVAGAVAAVVAGLVVLLRTLL